MDWQKKNLCLHETNPLHTIVDPHASALRLHLLPGPFPLHAEVRYVGTSKWSVLDHNLLSTNKIQTTFFFRLAKMLTLPFASLVLTNHLPSLFQHRAVLGALAGELDKLKVENRGKQLFNAVGVGRTASVGFSTLRSYLNGEERRDER